MDYIIFCYFNKIPLTKTAYRKLEFSLSYGFRSIDSLWKGWHEIVREEGTLAPYILSAYRKQEREQEVGEAKNIHCLPAVVSNTCPSKALLPKGSIAAPNNTNNWRPRIHIDEQGRRDFLFFLFFFVLIFVCLFFSKRKQTISFH